MESRLKKASKAAQQMKTEGASGSCTIIGLTLGHAINTKTGAKTNNRIFLILGYEPSVMFNDKPHTYQETIATENECQFKCAVLTDTATPFDNPGDGKRKNFALSVLKKDYPGMFDAYPDYAVSIYPVGSFIRATPPYKVEDNFAPFAVCTAKLIPQSKLYDTIDEKTKEKVTKMGSNFTFKSLDYGIVKRESGVPSDGIKEIDTGRYLCRAAHQTMALQCSKGNPGFSSGYKTAMTDWLSFILPLSIEKGDLVTSDNVPGVTDMILSYPDGKDFEEVCNNEEHDFKKDYRESDEKTIPVMYSALNAVYAMNTSAGKAITRVCFNDLIRKYNMNVFSNLGITNNKMLKSFLLLVSTPGCFNSAIKGSTVSENPHNVNEEKDGEEDAANISFNVSIQEIYLDWQAMVEKYGVPITDTKNASTIIGSLLTKCSGHFDSSNVNAIPEVTIINNTKANINGRQCGMFYNSSYVAAKPTSGVKFFILFPPHERVAIAQNYLLKQQYDQARSAFTSKNVANGVKNAKFTAETTWINDAKRDNAEMLNEVAERMRNCTTETFFQEIGYNSPQEMFVDLEEFFKLRPQNGPTSMLIVAINETASFEPLRFSLTDISGITPKACENFNEITAQLEMSGHAEWLEKKNATESKKKNGGATPAVQESSPEPVAIAPTSTTPVHEEEVPELQLPPSLSHNTEPIVAQEEENDKGEEVVPNEELSDHEERELKKAKKRDNHSGGSSLRKSKKSRQMDDLID